MTLILEVILLVVVVLIITPDGAMHSKDRKQEHSTYQHGSMTSLFLFLSATETFN